MCGRAGKETFHPMANASQVPKDGPLPAAAKKKAVAKKTRPKKPVEPKLVIRPLATPAKRRQRHWGLLSAFVIIVILPIAATWW